MKRRRANRLTIEKLAHDRLDVRELRRRGFPTERGVEIGSSIRWPKIAQ